MSNEENQQKPLTYIIPHTHWDREWYVPFQYFRFRLVEMIDELLDLLPNNPKFKFFNLDGQTIVLEDYLEIKPQNEDRLLDLLKKERMAMGPWYLQCSPWLQTGEGIIRNLLYGNRTCRRNNVDPLNVGWVPDQFIHPPQFPQIYRGFGIENSAFSRGVGNQYEENPGMTCDFIWKGLDGSEVTAFHLRGSYGLCSHLNKNPMIALNQVVLDINKVNSFPWSTNLRVAFSGSDHLRPQKSLPEVIEIWNEEEEIVEDLGNIKIGSWKEFLDEYHSKEPQLKEVEGELFGRKYSVSFHDVFSSYMPLKQQSFQIHDLLEHWSEPFSVLSSHLGLDYKFGFIKTAWKWLLKNQPHDSSWTSSVDQVQKEMEIRFDWAKQIGTDVFRRAAQWIVQKLEVKKESNVIPIVVFNPHPWKRTGLVKARFENTLERFQVLNELGKEITAQTKKVKKNMKDRDRRRVYVGSHGPVGKNLNEVMFNAKDIPPLGYKTYLIRERDPNRDLELPPEGLLDGNDYYLENDVLRIIVEKDGTFSIMHRVEIEENEEREKIVAMGEELPAGSIWAEDKFYTYKNLHLFENHSDIGDGWESIQIQGEKAIITPGKLLSATLIEASDFRGVIEVKKTLIVPREVLQDESQRSEETVEIPVKTLITINKGNDPVVRFKTTLKNLAKDHKLRVLFPTKLKTEKVSVNGHFGVFERNIKKPNGKDWVRPPQSTFPFHKWLSIWDKEKKRGLAIFSKGLPEYEAHFDQKENVSLGLTLFRSTRRWGSHINVSNPKVWTPRAQLFGNEMNFEYAIVPLEKKWNDYSEEEKPLHIRAEEYYTPIKHEESYDTYRYSYSLEKQDKNLPNQQGFIEISPSNIVYSSLKGCEDWIYGPKKYILRVYNILNEESSAVINFLQNVNEIKFLDLKEDPLDTQPDYQFNKKENELKFKIGANRIQSIGFNFD